MDEDLSDEDVHHLTIESADGRILGLIQFSEESDPDYRHASIDIYVDPAVHRQGIATDAIRGGERGRAGTGVVEELRHSAAAATCGPCTGDTTAPPPATTSPAGQPAWWSTRRSERSSVSRTSQ
jgi:hypothetical protein